MIRHNIPLVLASGSAIRAQMLKAVGLQFSVVPSAVDEAALKPGLAHLPPREQALALAKAKAAAVAIDYPDHITIGADQICALGEKRIFSKPGTADQAAEQLLALAGTSHQQWSACCIMRGSVLLWDYCDGAELTLRELSEQEIRAYVEGDQPLHACGSYHFEGLGRHLFAGVKGDHDVVKGLPLTPLLLALHQHNIIAIN